MKVDAVYVTYYPDLVLFERSINSIASQVRKIYIVDNTPGKEMRLESFRNEKTEIIYLGDNFGIAYAQNVGLKKALENSADYILLSDQDTIYPENYIQEMLKAFSYNEKVAAVAPKFKDLNKGHDSFFIKADSLCFKKIYPKGGLHEIMQAIASGKIINAKFLKNIGLMNEELFIELIDIEWCWRARKKGYKIIGNADVWIAHKYGDSYVKIGRRKITIRSPERQYYIVRNIFYLLFYSNSLDIFRRIVLFFKAFRYMIFYPLLVKPHRKNLKYVLLGFWHGINKKLGRLQ